MESPSKSPDARPSAVATLVATLAGSLFLILGTLFLSLLAIVLGWIPPRGRVVFRLARFWSRCVLFFSGVGLDSSARVELDRSSSYVFMANHQSLFDIPALLVSAPVETRFMAKRSLFQIPIFGWALKLAGFVSIDRKSAQRSRSGFTSALRELRSGASILIFPEGTRSLDGELLSFKRGGLLLAMRSGFPIVPVGIRGTLAIRPRNSYLIRPGTAVIRYGEPLDPTAYGARESGRLGEELRSRIAELADLD